MVARIAACVVVLGCLVVAALTCVVSTNPKMTEIHWPTPSAPTNAPVVQQGKPEVVQASVKVESAQGVMTGTLNVPVTMVDTENLQTNALNGLHVGELVTGQTVTVLGAKENSMSRLVLVRAESEGVAITGYIYLMKGSTLTIKLPKPVEGITDAAGNLSTAWFEVNK